MLRVNMNEKYSSKAAAATAHRVYPAWKARGCQRTGRLGVYGLGGERQRTSPSSEGRSCISAAGALSGMPSIRISRPGASRRLVLFGDETRDRTQNEGQRSYKRAAREARSVHGFWLGQCIAIVHYDQCQVGGGRCVRARDPRAATVRMNKRMQSPAKPRREVGSDGSDVGDPREGLAARPWQVFRVDWLTASVEDVCESVDTAARSSWHSGNFCGGVGVPPRHPMHTQKIHLSS